MKNYYEILEVHPNASKEVIDKAYKVLVKKYHPDLYGGESLDSSLQTQKIKEINEAYHVLSNDFLREQYNLELQKEKEKVKSTKTQKEQAPLKKRQEETEEIGKTKKPAKVGSFSGLVELTKELLKNRPQRQKKEITKTDILAVILTIIVIILLGIILWFIPFTNGWMRELLFENPLFNWIGRLFS